MLDFYSQSNTQNLKGIKINLRMKYVILVYFFLEKLLFRVTCSNFFSSCSNIVVFSNFLHIQHTLNNFASKLRAQQL